MPVANLGTMPLAARVTILSIAIGLSAIVAIWAPIGLFGHFQTAYLFTPLTTILILGLAATAPRARPLRYKWCVVAGLVFSLAGDVFLMLPREQFVSGLSCFLLAHICYLGAFVSDSPFAARPGAFAFWAAAGLVVLGILWPGVSPALRVPVLLYEVAILTMASQAASRALNLKSWPAIVAGLGAALFVVSDTLLAVNRFRFPLPCSRALVLGTYFTAQWLIALSAVLRPPFREPSSAALPPLLTDKRGAPGCRS
jgi:uncharacterized membrane protein YhhN